MTRVVAKKVDPSRTRLVQELKHTTPLMGCRFDGSPCGFSRRFALVGGRKRGFNSRQAGIDLFAPRRRLRLARCQVGKYIKHLRRR